MKRTHTCGELRGTHCGEQVTLEGWVKRRRDMGNLIFLDIRDREGITQVVCDPTEQAAAHHIAHTVRSEYVVRVSGTVRSRGDQVNSEMPTGEIEILAEKVEIYSAAKTPPFPLDDETPSDDIRLQYRYLDLRRPHLRKGIEMRHKVMQAVRRTCDERGFWEVETPMLTRSTPEGARDYLVPSRVHPGSFYALPQSPQLLKQLLMVSGAERYFQICRCFRDEDLRADRQPEFTQIDLEMSFASQEDVWEVTESILAATCGIGGYKISLPLLRITHAEAIDLYGSDKPDTRFDWKLVDIKEAVSGTSFGVFENVIKADGVIKALRVPGGASLTRKQTDVYNEIATRYGAKGVLPVTYAESGEKKSPLVKFLNDEQWAALEKCTGAENGDRLFIVADEHATACAALGAVRLAAAKDMDAIPNDSFSCIWITDFPLFTYSEEEERWTSEHHPFTMPNADDISLMDTEPQKVRSWAYDLVVNGYELGSGSVRIHDRELQEKVFSILQLEKKEIRERFGFFLNALEYGTPPHAGIALGLDRLVMLIMQRDSLRDVITFPKTQNAVDLMTSAPSNVRDEQLEELHLELHNLTENED